MKYGKIRIEDGYLVFTRHMMSNNLPCRDILWAYLRREGVDDESEKKQLIVNYLVVVTKRRKRYKFDMTEKEVQECLTLLKALNPEMTVGFPRGSRIPLKSLPNTRDLGALLTEDGRHILPRKLIRSGELYHVSFADRKILTEEYRLTKVIDLRTPKERERKPDTAIPGVSYSQISIIDEESDEICRTKDMVKTILEENLSEEKMCLQYENFIRDQFCVKQFARFLDEILHQGEGAVLWHCSMGKDRAGVATALLLCILGVPRETIREDFLKSNLYLDGEMEYAIRLLETRTIVTPQIMERIRILFKVKEEYLDAVFDTIERYYGTMERFIRRALYLTPKAVEDLQNKYLI
ncbi:MAG TPA: tyrosine-protein phosphatase [Candidatus Blautia faecigallinarum]|uniref:Tyrosine-protein phosphatase n=1 Tax=Candidatus Blautia faecigallinarum TaxID=2838488 RepID=A0A9D2DR63_9FIRM|nr:tyrosine-protein phosphatase [Candidatus Blautia faecigallinarum]